MKSNLFPTALSFKILFLVTTLLFFGCEKEEEDDIEPTTTTKTITVGVYLLNGSTYTDSNKDLIFTTGEACQSWSRTAQGSDGHSDTSHDHFNAAKNVTYDDATSTITWTEFGPETTQAAIDATCSAGTGGVTKTANKTGYSQDKNFYLQIKIVE
jgi:hypothetical protein